MQTLISLWNRVRNFNLERYIFGPKSPAVGVSRLMIVILGSAGTFVGMIHLAIWANDAVGVWVWLVPLGMLVLTWIVWALKPHEMNR